MKYVPPLFRPPSEAESLIFQVTYGCSHDTCTFCRMYSGKPFRKRKEADVLEEFEKASRIYPNARRIFLADGDAMVLSSRALILYLERLYQLFPRLERVSAYASPQNLLRKKPSSLSAIRKAGLKLLYLGVESGSDEILRRVKKGVNSKQIIESCRLAKEANFILSVTVILGLGGKNMSDEHAKATGQVLTECKPDYIGALTLMFHEGNSDFPSTFGSDWKPLTVEETLEEERKMIISIGCDECEFRSNHASNWLPLKGRLQRDKDALLSLIDKALKCPDRSMLRPEWMRGL